VLDILTIIPKPPPAIRVLDIGAMIGGVDPYEPLRGAGIAQVVGFEPQAAECEKLNTAHAAKGHRYLPHFIGDGSRRTFHVTRDGYSSSLYEPDLALASKFQQLGELYQVVRTEEVQTTRLDDLRDIRPIDLAKIDTQGGELDVIRGGRETLREALVIHIEVEFVPLYKNQPLFADIDAALRELGFVFHKFHEIHGPPFAPLVVNNQPFRRISQMLWGDAVYVRDFMRFDELPRERLIKLAVIVHAMYGAADLAHLALSHADPALAASYLQALMRPGAPA
jgi:FkbM family methyltransferase